ncbi:MAG: PilZ domain-containing protein [Planctomycetota bacterium]
MNIKKRFINRERRFEIETMEGFDVVVRRVGTEREDAAFFAEIVDFSRTGMKFNLPFCARFDELLDFELEFQDREDLEYNGRGRVRHLRKIDDQRWQVGCSIEPCLTEEVISYLARCTNQERRRNDRGDIYGEGRIKRQGQMEYDFAQVKNLSRGGFCLVVEQGYEVGERIDFVTEDSDDQEIKVAARIRWQEKLGEFFEIGCGFADTDSYDQLIECFGEEEEEVETDRVNWLVVSAALLALIFPTLSYFLLASSSSSMQVASHEEPEPNKITRTIKNEPPEPLVQTLILPPQNIEPVKQTTKREDENKNEIQRLESPLPTPPKTQTDSKTNSSKIQLKKPRRKRRKSVHVESEAIRSPGLFVESERIQSRSRRRSPKPPRELVAPYRPVLRDPNEEDPQSTRRIKTWSR